MFITKEVGSIEVPSPTTTIHAVPDRQFSNEMYGMGEVELRPHEIFALKPEQMFTEPEPEQNIKTTRRTKQPSKTLFPHGRHRRKTKKYEKPLFEEFG